MEDPPSSFQLTENVIKSLSIAKLVPGASPINSIDYHSNGQSLITSGGGVFTVYDTSDGEQSKKLYSQKSGTDLVRFAHHPHTIIYSGTTPFDCSLKYLSLFDNRHLRFFRGHTDQILSIDLCPTSDQFLSSSSDNTVRLWDISSTNCSAMLKLDPGLSRPCVAFDPAGMVFAVAASPFIKLFNLRQLGGGPFAEFTLEEPIRSLEQSRRASGQSKLPVSFTSCKFDATGQHILITTNQGVIYLVDSFQGRLERTFTDFKFNENVSLEASFSPDANVVMSGTDDGSVLAWKTSTGQLLHSWMNVHQGPVRCIKFNPQFANFATSCTNLGMWLPDFQSTKV